MKKRRMEPVLHVMIMGLSLLMAALMWMDAGTKERIAAVAFLLVAILNGVALVLRFKGHK